MGWDPACDGGEQDWLCADGGSLSSSRLFSTFARPAPRLFPEELTGRRKEASESPQDHSRGARILTHTSVRTQDPDPTLQRGPMILIHTSERTQDPDPHFREDQDPDPHFSEDQDPDPTLQ
ncbi:unnamed protein product [Pleuronectes platessa]|uniref:Uncharacterized protein n=1 Tax=Pleuronectes platessa TaxID=8262 RepID=A0A9N7Z6Q8_PLEPL|nr:unnamed protein product [Pleuronectes platessa]